MTDLKNAPSAITDDDKPEKKAPLDFSAHQLAAGALAACTAAVLGSQLGTGGTVLGAGLGSVISALSTTFYSAGLERTTNGLRVVVSRRKGVLDEDESPETVSDPSTPELPATPGASATSGSTANSGISMNSRRSATSGASAARKPTHRRALVIASVSVVVSAIATFALTMLAVTGIETATGRALDGGDTPTVTRVVPAAAPASADPSASASPTPEASATAEPTAVETPAASAEPSDGTTEPAADATATASPVEEPSAAATPTPQPSAGQTSN